MTEHFSEGECFSLFMTGLTAPALIIGGLASIAVGIYFGMATENMVAAVIAGAAAFGAGCGILSIIGFYYWHRAMVESQRSTEKTPIDVNDWTEE